jgi:diguanylate cyclase (GGDEF)-like protein/PAS domain S-box-containing protein
MRNRDSAALESLQIASEEALRRHGEQLAGIIALQTQLADDKLDVRGICNLVVDATRRLIGTGAAAIQFVEGDEFVYFAATEERKQLVGARTSLEGNFSAAILESGKAILCDDTQSDPRIDAAASLRAGARSLIGAPMHYQGRVVGILKLISGEPRAFRAEQLSTLELLAGIAGSAVQRKRAQEELRRSEERFRSLSNLSSDWYWEQDAGLRFTKFEGKAGDKRLANVPTEVLGRCAWQLAGIVPDAADWDGLRRTMLAHQAFRQFEYCYESRSGERRYIAADGEPMFDEQGAFVGYRGTARDITEQRRGEEALRRFRAAMDMSHDAVYLTDRATLRFVDVNEPAWKGTGYTQEELMRVGPQGLLGKPREELEREYDAVIAAGEAGITSETSYRSAKGRTRWTELQRRPLRAGDRWIIVTVSRDITERKRAEELQARHLRLQERTARFGQSALAKRDAAELVEDAVFAVREGLSADGVAYIEATAGDGFVLRELAGVPEAPATPSAIEAAGPGLREAFEPDCGRLTGDAAQLGPPWARDFGSAAIVPVRNEGTVRGVLCVLRRPADAFAPEEVNFVEAVAGVLATALQRVDSEGKLAFLAQFDALTGLPNRALLRDRFSMMIVQARRRGTQLGVLFVDLDEFKLVNDSLGHAAGDALLQQVAQRLQASVRAGDTVARIAGDEFAVILGDLGRVEDAALVAQKLIDRLASSYEVARQEIFVTASVGIAVFPGDGEDAESLLAAADAAMYKAKQGGRNAYQFFTAEITQRTRARAVIGSELRRALEREEFSVYYQPKIDLQTLQVCGAEALLRWNHPQRGLVPPAEFISVLEETGLIVAAGEWVLGRACADTKALGGAAARPLSVAVNLSARQFRQQELAPRVQRIVQSAGVDPALLELEITESQLMHDPQHAATTVHELAAAGIRITIDDFGTGYSSLAYLSRFRVGSLKIDRSFVAGMMSRKGDAAIVRAILHMARALEFTVVAEGVETQAQADALRKLRCDQAQGYLFARPMPVADFKAFLASAAPPARRRTTL